MNKKLGIVGGISIIGTTGIVEPWSEKALRDSLIPQLDVALAQGYDEVVLTPGRIGERTAIEKGVPEDAIIQMGNFVGDMLMECVKRGIKKAVLFGHVGKLTKVAAGFFNTHSRASASALEVIARHASLYDIRREVVDSLLEANTAEHAVEILGGEGALVVFDSLAEKAAKRAEGYVDGKMKISTAFISLKGEVVGRYNLEASKWGKYLL
jgi:cobalt-precorrin-5B (C1)-methyltransferase